MTVAFEKDYKIISQNNLDLIPYQIIDGAIMFENQKISVECIPCLKNCEECPDFMYFFIDPKFSELK